MKQDIICQNAQHFNDESQIFKLCEQDVEKNLPQSPWDLTSPSIAQEDGLTLSRWISTIKN